MSETVEELTIEWKDEGGQVITKELAKEVLTRGAWATLMFKYQDLDRATGEYGKAKFRIQRYQKRSGAYRAHSKFNISSVEQAKMIVDILNRWIDEEAE